MIKDYSKITVIFLCIVNILLSLLIITLIEKNRAGSTLTKEYLSKKEYMAKEPNLTSYLRQKYNNTSKIIDRVEFPEREIAFGSIPLLPEKSDSNMGFPFLNIEKLNLMQAELENWDKLSDTEKIEITEKIKSTIMDMVINEIKDLSYKDIESDKEHFKSFFKMLKIMNEKQYQNIKINVNSPGAAEDIKQLTELLKSIQDMNSKQQ